VRASPFRGRSSDFGNSSDLSSNFEKYSWSVPNLDDAVILSGDSVNCAFLDCGMWIVPTIVATYL
jgi:hypothetical protein